MAKPFTITDSRQLDTLTPAGTTQTVYRVWITTARGATGTVDVNKADWNIDGLAKILAEKANELDLAFMLADGLG